MRAVMRQFIGYLRTVCTTYPRQYYNVCMTASQQTLGFAPAPYKTRKARFLEEMERIVPWAQLLALIAPYYPPEGKRALGGRPAYPLEVMLRVHCLQLWWNLGDERAQEELYECPTSRAFARLDGAAVMPDETTILRFRHLLETHDLAGQVFALVNEQLEQRGLLLKRGTLVDATIIAAPSSTKNKQGKRDEEMHQTQKSGQWHFGMKAHTGTDADSGLVHTVVYTAANVHDISVAGKLLHGQEECVWGDAGYQGVDKRPENADSQVQWITAMRPGKRRALPKTKLGRLLDEAERIKARVRAKVEHPFRVIKLQFGYAKARYRGMKKNAARLTMLFAFANLCKVKKQLLAQVA